MAIGVWVADATHSAGLRYTEHRTQNIQNTWNVNEQAQHKHTPPRHTATATAASNTQRQRLHKEAAHTGTDEVDAVEWPRGDAILSSEAGRRGRKRRQTGERKRRGGKQNHNGKKHIYRQRAYSHEEARENEKMREIEKENTSRRAALSFTYVPVFSGGDNAGQW